MHILEHFVVYNFLATFGIMYQLDNITATHSVQCLMLILGSRGAVLAKRCHQCALGR